MKKIFMAGLMAVLAVGIMGIIVKFVLIDFLAVLARPFILFLFGKEWLVIPLAVVSTILIIFIVGLLLSQIKLRRLIDRVSEKFGPKGECGALVILGPGVYFVAIIIKEIEWEKPDGTIMPQYVLYAPYAPLPWSGLPIIVADKDKVIPVKISYQKLYSIVASFGKNTPARLESIKNKEH